MKNFRLVPNYERIPNFQDILGSYMSAQKAFAAGNHYVALLKARAEKETELEAASLIMCGATERGLNTLKPGTLPQEAYGHWCLGDKATATKVLKRHQGFESLISLLENPVINVFILYGPHTRHGVSGGRSEGFDIRSALVERDEHLSSLSEVVPPDFQPDAILILDIYGPRLPDDLYDFDGPIIILNYDFDFQLPHQYQDLKRADLVVVNTAYEHFFLDRIYDCPVSTFPAFKLNFNPLNFSKPSHVKDIDFLHTGLSFTPTMREKAQFLFRIAAVDNQELEIRIHHGYMEYEEYISHVLRTKFMPIVSRWYGAIQSRPMDAICNGSIALHGGEDVAIGLFEYGRLAIRQSSPSNLEDDINRYLATYPEDWKSYTKNHGIISTELNQIFLEPRERNTRFLKFCLFEVVRNGHCRKKHDDLRTTSVIGLKQCLSLAKYNKDNAHSLYSLAIYRAIEATLVKPLDEKWREIVKSIFSEASSHHPNSLALIFNYARFLWMVGEDTEAYEKFHNLLDGLHLHLFEPTRDQVWLIFFENASEMMPPEGYFIALTKDLAASDKNAKTARSVIGATALCYMALYQLQKENFREGLVFLDQALDLHPNHFPAARLRFKTLHTLGEDWKATSTAFDLAVNLYPPCLTDLLAFGVSAELAQNNEREALSLIKTWACFISRCTWQKESSPKIPEATWTTVRTFFHRLPEYLQAKLKERFPDALG